MNPGKKNVSATRSAVVIRSDADLKRATRELCGLMSSKASLTGKDEKRFHYLVKAIEEYEDANYPIPEPTHADLLGHLLDANAIGAKELARVTKVPVEYVQDILEGKRQITHQEGKAFAKFFHVEPSIFDPGPDAVVVLGITFGSGSVGRQVSGWFQVTSRSVAERLSLVKKLPAAIMHLVSQQAGSGVLRLV